MTQQKVVLDEDDIRRTLVRIAHEIVEKNADGDVALVGIHRRGAHLATRLHGLVCDLLDADVPRGDIDIALYRDDLATRGADASPVVHASHLPFRLEDHTVRSEEHTSELQSRQYLVCRLLLEKKKKNKKQLNNSTKIKR